MSAHSITSEVIPDPTRQRVTQLNHFTFSMRRRSYRKARRTRRRRGSFRRRSVVRKALSLARSVTRKMAGEVRKLDVNAIIPEENFTVLTPALGTAADNAQSLPDFGYVYNVFGGASVQGLEIDDFTGN